MPDLDKVSVAIASGVENFYAGEEKSTPYRNAAGVMSTHGGAFRSDSNPSSGISIDANCTDLKKNYDYWYGIWVQAIIHGVVPANMTKQAIQIHAQAACNALNNSGCFGGKRFGCPKT